VLVGLIAGKPIWAKDAKVEASTKAVVGGLLGAALLAALRTWLMIPVPVSLAPFGPEHAMVGGFAVTALATVAAILGGFYEADNSPSENAGARVSGARSAGSKGRIAGPKGTVEDVDELPQDEAKKHQRR
jgi:hypothetical protein